MGNGAPQEEPPAGATYIEESGKSWNWKGRKRMSNGGSLMEKALKDSEKELEKKLK